MTPSETMKTIRSGKLRNGHLVFHTTAPELFSEFKFIVALRPHNHEGC